MQSAAGTVPRQRLIQAVRDEVQALAAGRDVPGIREGGGRRSKVRKVIMQEIEALLAADRLGAPGAEAGAAAAAGSALASRMDFTDVLQAYAQSRAASGGAGSMPRKPFKHTSLPDLRPLTKIEPAADTRKKQYRRGYGGSFCSDAPAWQLENNTIPILPSKHRTISHSLWCNANPVYLHYNDVSHVTEDLPDPKQKGPQVSLFMNPRDEFVIYREEIFKPGNKLVMRKGGGSMAKSKT
mmetsp:Transcript_49370/g.86972  ORF Transcript_49370/g.86972 Transcript_49370/m.86972 type:complete len:239 (-) Transcript_49370:35-751(-)